MGDMLRCDRLLIRVYGFICYLIKFCILLLDVLLDIEIVLQMLLDPPLPFDTFLNPVHQILLLCQLSFTTDLCKLGHQIIKTVIMFLGGHRW